MIRGYKKIKIKEMTLHEQIKARTWHIYTLHALHARTNTRCLSLSALTGRIHACMHMHPPRMRLRMHMPRH